MEPKHIKMVQNARRRWDVGRHEPIAEDWDSWCTLFKSKLFYRCGEKRSKIGLPERCEKKRERKGRPAPILLRIDNWKYHMSSDYFEGPTFSFRSGLYCSINCPYLGILSKSAKKARAMFKEASDE